MLRNTGEDVKVTFTHFQLSLVYAGILLLCLRLTSQRCPFLNFIRSKLSCLFPFARTNRAPPTTLLSIFGVCSIVAFVTSFVLMTSDLFALTLTCR